MTIDDAPAASFSSDSGVTIADEHGRLGHRAHIEHGSRFERQLFTVADGVWCLVGNGLSNQTFVEGPGGLIVIDTGESIEEMRDALTAVREMTKAPIAAVIYTHFHYVGGTAAIAEENLAVASFDDLPVWGHERIVANRDRAALEISAVYGRGLVHQFGIALPSTGPDGLTNVGLGKAFRNAEHAPFTAGFVSPNHPIDGPTTAQIAGLDVRMTPAPSDANDSITISIPTLGLCINNLVWPAVFNVFPIRGEEYRDPRVLMTGLDGVLALKPEHLVGAHGPPLSGVDAVREEVERYRDSIQFMWDQTARGINRGLTTDELTQFVQLPDCFGGTYFTQQFYGLVEHHVRQICNGLIGWFGGYEADLFPVPVMERTSRMIEGFGGRDAVREQAVEALAADDLRWALELATWLVRSERGPDGRADGGTAEDRAALGAVLRAIAQRTTSANIRSWCLTRALELDGELDLDRFRVHRFSAKEVAAGDPISYVHALRVVLDPSAASGIDDEIVWRFRDGVTAGLRIRNCVAVPTDGTGADAGVESDLTTFASVIGRRLGLREAIESGSARVIGDVDRVGRLLACFDHEDLQLT